MAEAVVEDLAAELLDDLRPQCSRRFIARNGARCERPAVWAVVLRCLDCGHRVVWLLCDPCLTNAGPALLDRPRLWKCPGCRAPFDGCLRELVDRVERL
jgi:hypothetical protein